MLPSITIILLALFAQAALGEEHYHIVPINSTSLCQHYPNGTCFTLDTFSSQIGNTKNRSIKLCFLPGEHLLTRDMIFNDMHNITLINEPESNTSPRISCVENIGLTISNSNTVIMNGLEIYGCVNWGAILSFYDVGSLFMQDCKFLENVNKSPNICEPSYRSGTTHIVRTAAVIRNCIYKGNSVYNPYFYRNICIGAKPGGGAVYIEDSAIEIDWCSFENNFVVNTMYTTHGGAIAILGSAGNITNSIFTNNQVQNLGGAIYLNMLQTQRFVLISKCKFYNNNAEFGGAIAAYSTAPDDPNIYSNITLTDQTKCACICSENKFRGNTASQYGGAAYSFISIKFENDSFIKNWALIDGGAIMFTGPLVTVKLRNCTFTEHRPKHNSIETALITGHRVEIIITNIRVVNNSQSLYAETSQVKFYGHSKFINNRLGRQLGGAIKVIGSTITCDNSSTTEILSNEAQLGGGLYLEDSTLTVYGTMLIQGNIAQISGGGIYAYQSVMEFVLMKFEQRDTNYICVSNNTAKEKDGGGMYLTSSRLNNIMHVITISDNHASRFGGGLFLLSNSKVNIKVKDTLSLLIFLHLKRNSALKGGGIYVSDKSSSQNICSETDDFESSQQLQCFIQQPYGMEYTSGTSTATEYYVFIYLENNTAVQTGPEIYGGLLDRCLMDPNNFGKNFIKYNVGWSWGSQKKFRVVDGKPSSVYTIQNTSELFNHISSDPVKVCFCVDNIVDCTLIPPTVHKKKGETFTLSVVAVDQVGKPVDSTLFSSINLEGRKGGLKVGQQFRTLQDQCTELQYNVYYDQIEAVLELYPKGPCGNQGLSKKEVHIVFNTCICPMGFEQLNSSINCSCDCTEALKPYIKQCWQDEGTFQLDDNNWIQNINNTGFIVHECPFDFCVKQLPNISLSESSNIQCAFNRSGLLCGECTNGLSLVLASSQCQPCSNYYLFLLLPFGLAGIALVAFILLLNMTVATGTIHGLIFYANTLTANRSVFLPFDGANILTVFISWLNLDLGIETCFYDGMDSYGKLMLQFVFPAYVIFLIVTIMVLCDRSQRIARLFGKRNPEATLYTLFLLSYSKLIRTIITALQFTTLNYPDGSKEIVWLYDANVKYFALNHIPRFLAAFIITILGAVYTSLLLFGQLFNRYSEYRLMKWTSHKYYIHFMKAHHAPLSDKHRYWVGLLLLARLTHYLISAFTNDFLIVLSILIITLSILLHKIMFKSYSKISINLMETQFILNLSVFSGATLYVQLSGGDQQALAIVSMSISFIAFLGIVLYHILDNCEVKLKNVLTKILSTLRRRRDIDYHPVVIIESEDENASDESDEELIDLSNAPEDTATIELYDPSRYITPPIIRSALPPDQLREPLLDDCPLTPTDYNLQLAAPPTRQKQAPTVSEVAV